MICVCRHTIAHFDCLGEKKIRKVSGHKIASIFFESAVAGFYCFRLRGGSLEVPLLSVIKVGAAPR